MKSKEIKLSEIKICERVRKDVGSIADLARSIEEVGLLHPVVITDARRLVSGRRRIEAHIYLSGRIVISRRSRLVSAHSKYDGTMSATLTELLDTDHRMNNSLRQHCDWCPEMIEPGESIWRLKLADGETLRMHHECFVAACPDGEFIETGPSHVHPRGSKELM